MKQHKGKRSRFWKRFLIVSVIFLITGFIGAHFIGKRLGYSGAWDFITSFGSHSSRGLSANYETIDIKIDKQDYKKLKSIRDKAVKDGIQLDVADPWVKGAIIQNGKEIKIKLRLKGHMTDHLEGKKWSFRIKTRKGNSFRGMQIFSIQHPGTRGYAYEWIFHEVMKREGLIALNYDFINVNLNGENLGIYALEENFGEELIERNKRPDGPIVRFNPDMYWVFRHDELIGKGKTFLHESATWKSSYLEPLDDNEVFSDSSLLRSYSEALLLMNEFRNGRVATSYAFDYKSLAIYHAWIDIIGGTHSLDWTDVKYYYNPVTRLFEPIVYESFSAFPVYSLSGQFRCTGDTVKRDNFHDMLFSDTVFYAEYIRQLTRMSDETWIKKTLKTIDKGLQSRLDILYSEWPYRDFTTEIYKQNAASIRKMLRMPMYVNAFYEKKSTDSLYFSAAAIDGFPVVINSVKIEGKKYNIENQHLFIPAKAKNSAPIYSYYSIFLNDSVLAKIKTNSEITLSHSILGSKNSSTTIIVPLPPQPRVSLMQIEVVNMADQPFVEVDKYKKTIFIKPGKHEISKSVKVDEGYTLLIGPGTKLELSGSLAIYGQARWEGSEEYPVEIVRGKHQTGNIIFYNKGVNYFSHVHISEMGGMAALIVCNSQSTFKNVKVLASLSSGILILKGSATFTNVLVSSVVESGIQFYSCTATLANSVVSHCKANGIEVSGSNLLVRDTEILNCQKTGIRSEFYAQVTGGKNKISNCKSAIHAKNGSVVQLNQGTISGCETGIKTTHEKDTHGFASVVLVKVEIKDVKKEKSAAAGTTISVQK
ncbi:MAG: right-handed parallel beta-helix repeat-containing protein [Flavobacteriales bacterium]